jgi:sugar phosphate isomerase/epimerase
MFILSTSWNARKHCQGQDIVEEIKRLGFSEVELNFTLTSQIVKEIAQLKQEDVIKIRSLHNYCPIPYGVKPNEAGPDCYSLASPKEGERKRAVCQTKHTIDTAYLLRANVVILHIGKVDMERRTKTLIEFYQRGLKGTREYNNFKTELVKEREKKHRRFLACALQSLEELSLYAAKFKIALGIENRYYFQEIPSIEELDEILCNFSDKNIFYWHDVGHAQNLENLGLVKHTDYLDKFSENMIGIHLHDIIGTRDHLAPGCGNFDFRILKPYIHNDILKVIEAHPPATREEIVRGVKYLESIFGE